MANGNGSLTPAKTLGISILLTSLINGIALVWLQEHGNEIRQGQIDLNDLRHELNRKTDQRYRQTDAERDIRENWRLIEARLSNIAFRFDRNEENIRQCLEHTKEHE